MKKKLADLGMDYNEGYRWETRYCQGDIPWDRGRPVPAVQEALNFFAPRSRILVPGCGCGHDTAALARGGHTAVGWDISPTALARAKRLYPSGPVEFVACDLLGENDFCGVFDGIFEHTFLCAIGPEWWERAAERFSELLRPGGKIFAILFTNMVEEQPPPWPITEAEVRKLFLPKFEIESPTRPRHAFPGREGEETIWRMQRR